MRREKWCGDFETTTYKGITETEVWSACWCEVKPNSELKIVTNIDDFMHQISKGKDKILYFHNLKFDGSFILNWLFNNSFKYISKTKSLEQKQFTSLISDIGSWYTIDVNFGSCQVQFRDSLKLLPFSLKTLGKSFNLETQKGVIDYSRHKHKDEQITEEERKYIYDDVIILRESLLKMFDEKHTSLTIGSCCLNEFKRDPYILNVGYEQLFPYHTDFEINGVMADEYIRKSYHGAFCYLKPEYKEKIIQGKGKTLDVNSLYPYVMSDSQFVYPTGKPTIIENPEDFITDFNDLSHYYFIEFECRFKLKEKKLPTVQIKNNPIYKPNEWLTTSDFYDKITKKYHRFYIKNGERKDTVCRFIMTQTDYQLFKLHYQVFDEKIIREIRYAGEKNIFTHYIDKYKKIKESSSGATRTIAKLFSNNLYGKMATSTNSSYKEPRLENGTLKFTNKEESEKNAGYIPIGSAITSYARCFIIEKAQKNYKNFIYCDTDSLHLLDGKLYDIEEHDNKYGAFKCENTWDIATFCRQKTYVEINSKTGEEVIKACGCPETSKKIISDLIHEKGIKIFKTGLTVGGKLVGKQIKGGMILEEQTFTIK